MAAIIAIALRMLFGFNDADTQITDFNQIISNVKVRIQELETAEKKEESDSESQVSVSKIGDLKTLLSNLELLQDLPTKRHLFKSMAETIQVQLNQSEHYIWRPQDLNTSQA
jgi:hypothetical protein